MGSIQRSMLSQDGRHPICTDTVKQLRPLARRLRSPPPPIPAASDPLRRLCPAPLFYEGGLGVKSRFGQSALTVLAIDAGGEQCSSFYRLLIGEDKADGRFAPAAQFIEGRQAAKGSVAPAGAKGWFRVSMCQIAWARRRAVSTFATFGPRWGPRRRLVRSWRSR